MKHTCQRMLIAGKEVNCILGGACMPSKTNTVEACPKFVKPGTHSAHKKPSAKPLPMVDAPCIHRGEENGLANCPSCKGNVQLKTFTCAINGKCTIGKQAPGVECCKGCTDYTVDEPLNPVRNVRVDLPPPRQGLPGHYNCGLVRHDGRLLMVSRLGWSGSRTYLSELADDYRVASTRDLGIQHPRAYSGVEDPRILAIGSELKVVVTGYESANAGATSILVASLDRDLKVASVVAPHYEQRLTWEKNWAPFEYDGRLHFVYTVNPHVILRMEEDKTIEVGRSTNIFPWRSTALRGGAPPVRVGNEYYHWFHSVQTTKKGKLVYGLALYAFAARPPFQVTRRVSHVIMTPDNEIRGWNKTVVFPCGAVLEDGVWKISYGKQDRECWIVEYDSAEVEKRLR